MQIYATARAVAFLILFRQDFFGSGGRNLRRVMVGWVLVLYLRLRPQPLGDPEFEMGDGGDC